MTPAISARGIVKRYARVTANDDVTLDVLPGDIHAVVGENGAGKSTLMRILYGLTPPDAGTIHVSGERVRFDTPKDAIAAGIGMVHQHFTLVGPLSVADNVLLGAEMARAGFLSTRAAERHVSELAARFGLSVPPRAVVNTLPVGIQQRVEILKALMRAAHVLILDEPTAVLTPLETTELFEALRALATSGIAILLITHRLEEVRSVADRVTVMRRGRVVGTHRVRDVSLRTLAEEMVGRSLPPPSDVSGPPPEARVRLSIANVSVTRSDGTKALQDLSLDVREGEIVGVAGVAGNGQVELGEAIAGLRPIAAGRIRLDGEDVTAWGRAARLEAGVAFIPEDRRERGLVPGMTVTENVFLGRESHPPAADRWGGLDLDAMRAFARERIAAHDIRPTDPDARVDVLSGGNQQKVVVAREVTDAMRCVVAAEPTRGVDIGAVHFIHERLRSLARGGAAILLSSSELPELLQVATRLVVLYRGRIVWDTTPAGVDLNRLSRAMLTGEADAA